MFYEEIHQTANIYTFGVHNSNIFNSMLCLYGKEAFTHKWLRLIFVLLLYLLCICLTTYVFKTCFCSKLNCSHLVLLTIFYTDKYKLSKK